jgi:hypothetical protein
MLYIALQDLDKFYNVATGVDQILIFVPMVGWVWVRVLKPSIPCMRLDENW